MGWENIQVHGFLEFSKGHQPIWERTSIQICGASAPYLGSHYMMGLFNLLFLEAVFALISIRETQALLSACVTRYKKRCRGKN